MAQTTQRSDHSRTVFRNTLRGEDAYSRHQRYVRDYLNVYGDSRAPSTRPKTDFDVLKEAHKFIRDENEDLSKLSYEDQLAVKYYSSLFKEFVICDLKHYKSGKIALRWRIDSEVIAGIGQFSCSNPRCAHHDPSSSTPSHPMPVLQAYELPFAYVEDGEEKHALVKAVLCPRCARRLVFKREKDKAAAEAQGGMPEVIDEYVPAVPARLEPAEEGRARRTDHEPGRTRESRSRSPRGRRDGDVEDGRYSRRRDRSS